MKTDPVAVEAAASARPQLLLFYSSSSGHSRRVEGFLAQVLQRRRNHDTFRIHRLDYEQHNDLARRCGVSEPPALVVVDGNMWSRGSSGLAAAAKSRRRSPHGCARCSS